MPDLESDSSTSVEDDVSLLESEEGNAEVKNEEVIEGKEVEEKAESEEESDKTKVSEPIPPYERPSITDLKTKYPEIFKDFPSLKDIYFREQEYTSLFPTIEEAKEAFKNAEAFETTRDDIFKGDGSKFFSAIKEVGTEELDKFAGKLLPALYKVSQDAHWKAALPLMENIARSLFNEGTRLKNEDMQNAARQLSQYLFSDVEIAEGKKTTIREEAKPDKSVEEDRNKFETEKLNAFTADVTTSASNDLRNLVKDKIEAEEDLSTFVKDAIIKRVMSEVGDQMQADKAHIGYMDALWAKAKKSGYSSDLKSRIISAYLARAKSLVPAVRSRLISEARGTRVKSSDKTREKIASVESRREATASGRSSDNGNKPINSKNIDWSRTSDEDILNDNITYRK